MEENSIITGQIPVTGSGVHKTYEESVIRTLKTVNVRSYNNEYFMDKEGSLHWATTEEGYEELTKQYKDGELIKVEILSAFSCGGNQAIVEFIDSKILRQHLIAEAVMRNQERLSAQDTANNSRIDSGIGMHRTYPESMFRIIDSYSMKKILERSHFGIYIRKSDGLVVIPVIEDDPDYRDFIYRRLNKELETLSNIQKNEENFIEVVILNSYINEKDGTFIAELISKDIYEQYISYERKLKC